MTEGTQIIASNTSRAYIPWQQIVSFKSIFILILVASGLIFSFINAYRKKMRRDKLAFSILLSTFFFGGAAVGLGGAGYLERLPSLTIPIIVYSIVKFGTHFNFNFNFKFKKYKYTKAVSGLVIVFA